MALGVFQIIGIVIIIYYTISLLCFARFILSSIWSLTKTCFTSIWWLGKSVFNSIKSRIERRRRSDMYNRLGIDDSEDYLSYSEFHPLVYPRTPRISVLV